MMMQGWQVLPIKKLSEHAITPTRGHEGDAGLDLYALDEIIIPKGGTIAVPTGIAMAIPMGYVGDVRPRSGKTLNSKLRVQYGTVDSPYRGEIKVICDNIGDVDIIIQRGEKIAQIVILPVPEFTPFEFDFLGETTRGEGGFGSTGNGLD